MHQGTADKILACGVTGQVMLLAQGVKLGNTTEEFLKARDLWCFVDQAKGLLSRFPDVFELPMDLASSGTVSAKRSRWKPCRGDILLRPWRKDDRGLQRGHRPSGHDFCQRPGGRV